ncbi:hypothetical protein BZA70DRAFT_280126 [Myxozyma melibiosi]|uniref:Translocon-associated protein subunit alpha n=1 Tax=Myxozyma melibiosi TaxID=54550 RepID=A0ABR1F4U2_9ASCO
MKFTTKALLGFLVAALATTTASVRAQEFDDDAEDAIAPKFVLETKFLDSTSPLTPVVLNTVSTNLEISLANDEENEAIVQIAGGALFQVGKDVPFENITATRVGPIQIPPHSKVPVPYSFVVDVEPKEYFLRIVLVIEYEGQLVQYLSYNSTVYVEDPPLSIFDPQMLFLYLILIALFGAAGYYTFTSYIQPKYFPKKKATKKRAAPAAASTVTAESAAQSTSVNAKGYDESWIPEHHLRSKSPKPRAVKKTGKKATK